MTLWQRLGRDYDGGVGIKYARDHDRWSSGRPKLACAGLVKRGWGPAKASRHFSVIKIVRISDLEPDGPSELL